MDKESVKNLRKQSQNLPEFCENASSIFAAQNVTQMQLMIKRKTQISFGTELWYVVSS
jgi:hypothetical protein